jgi:hypothetical protein
MISVVSFIGVTLKRLVNRVTSPHVGGGRVPMPDQLGSAPWNPCTSCGGSGGARQSTCMACNGVGMVPH